MGKQTTINREVKVQLTYLDDFISKFDNAHKSFYNRKDKPFRRFHQGPPIFFHLKTIEVYRRYRKRSDFSYKQLLEDIKFLEYLYATLTAWGMIVLEEDHNSRISQISKLHYKLQN